MADRSVRIVVGASVGARFSQVLKPLIEAAKQARAAIRGTAKESEKAAKESEKAFSQGAKKIESVYRSAAKRIEDDYDRIGKAAEKASDRSMRAVVRAARAEQREIARTAREHEKADKLMRRNAARMESRIRPIVGNALAAPGRLLRTGAGFAASLARGAGVDLDIGRSIGTATDLRARATTLSNAAFQPGAEGAAGVRQDPGALLAQVKEVANATGSSFDEALGGLEQFVKKTGDLDMGRQILKDMAILAKSTGTSLDDMVSAAGDSAIALGDTDNKAQKLNQVMRTIAGQGKLGAVEISDLAVQMAKVAASAPAFEGDTQSNLATMGALAQLARAKGGASSATQAATSVQGFVNTLKTNARVQQFKEAGVDIFNKKTGKMRDPTEIIVESLRSKGMDPVAFKKLFANVQGARAVEGLATTFRDAGGGEAGEKAVRAELDKLKSAMMGQGEIAESFARRMEDADSKIQVFNNRLVDVGDTILTKLQPHLPKIADAAIKATDAILKIADVVIENPGEVIVAAIVASIAKASIGSAISGAIAKAIAGVGIGGAATGLGGAGGAGVGGAGAAGSGILGALGISGALAGGIGLGFAGAIYGGGKAIDKQGERTQSDIRRDRASLFGDRAAIANAIKDQGGLDVNAFAGMSEENIRRLGRNSDESDKLVEAARKANMPMATGVDDDFARRAAGMRAFDVPTAEQQDRLGVEANGEPIKLDIPDPVPSINKLLGEQQRANSFLSQIATKIDKAPLPGRTGPEITLTPRPF